MERWITWFASLPSGNEALRLVGPIPMHASKSRSDETGEFDLEKCYRYLKNSSLVLFGGFESL